MRLAFLTSSLAPGRNGVGDYTRHLAAELDRQGHPCLAIGLADTETVLEEGGAPVVRLAADRPWPERLLQARAALAGFAPDWVSLQFVAYAWQPRGYAFGLAEQLAPLFGKRRRHLMIHELWVGLNRHDRFVNRLHGILQRRAILGLHRALQPHAVHTQAPVYVATLAAAGIAAKRLPLFGNLPVAPGDRRATQRQLLAEYAPQLALTPEQTLFAGWFGTVHREWDGPELIARLATATHAEGKHLVLLALGRTGAGGTTLVEALRRNPPPNSTLIVAGESAPANASRLLGALDVALTANPVALVPKSGTVAACLDHGLPILVSRDNWQPRGAITMSPLDEPGVVLSPAGAAVDLPALLALRRAPAARLPAVARQFAADLAAV
jgi:CheY-like chemotaxis protein